MRTHAKASLYYKYKKIYNPPNDFRVLQRFWSKVNELNEISRRERVDFAFQKSAQFIGSELL